MRRHFSSDERRLVEALLRRAQIYDRFSAEIDSWVVEDMDDGGMGSIRIHRAGVLLENTHMVSQASELQFRDADGAVVIVSLNLNDDGFPFEIDIWKTTFDPVIRIPPTSNFSDVVYARKFK